MVEVVFWVWIIFVGCTVVVVGIGIAFVGWIVVWIVAVGRLWPVVVVALGIAIAVVVVLMNSPTSLHGADTPRAILVAYIAAHPGLTKLQLADGLHWELAKIRETLRHACEHGQVHQKRAFKPSDDTYTIGAVKARQFKHIFCPRCAASDIRQRRDDWVCNRCGSDFKAPRKETPDPPGNGSGQIAGPTWRHQIARDILPSNERVKRTK